jgi:hypothetical protein
VLQWSRQLLLFGSSGPSSDLAASAIPGSSPATGSEDSQARKFNSAFLPWIASSVLSISNAVRPGWQHAWGNGSMSRRGGSLMERLWIREVVSPGYPLVNPPSIHGSRRGGSNRAPRTPGRPKGVTRRPQGIPYDMASGFAHSRPRRQLLCQHGPAHQG